MVFKKHSRFALVLLSSLALVACDFNSTSSETSSSSSSSSSEESSTSLVESSSSQSSNSSSQTSEVSSESSSSLSSITSGSSISSETSSSISSETSSSISSSSSSSSSTSSETDLFEATAYPSENKIEIQLSNAEKVTSLDCFYSSNNKTYIKVDNELVQLDKSRIAVLGLKEGTYSVKLVPNSSEDEALIINDIKVTDLDRSGYAHFNRTEGIGAYNLDGTLKEDAEVIYVNDENKNTVELKIGSKTYKGLGNILDEADKAKTPLDIRILGSINANQFKEKEYEVIDKDKNPSEYPERFVNEWEDKYTQLEGLQSKIYGGLDNDSAKDYYENTNGITFELETKSKDTDTSINMMVLQNAQDITIEGVFSDATINQWGLNIKRSSSIEVSNLTFKDYPEDACAFDGESSDVSETTNIFFHHNTILKGKNNWDLTFEQDKHEGDGGNDIKYISNYTSAYNRFIECHKTGLIGGNDSSYSANITIHHNYYQGYKDSQRMPLARRANVHMYNNYYNGGSVNQDFRAEAYGLSENNYFENCNRPYKLDSSDTRGYIKSYQDYLVNCGSVKADVVDKRDEDISAKCFPFNGNKDKDYSNFDTDPELFYYDETTNKSDVELMLEAKDVKAYLTEHSGSNYCL